MYVYVRTYVYKFVCRYVYVPCWDYVYRYTVDETWTHRKDPLDDRF